MNKRFYLFFIALLCTFGAIAQNAAKVPNLPKFDLEPRHFGFYLSGNQMFFVIDPADGFQNRVWYKNQIPDLVADSARIMGIEGLPVPGFAIGIVSNLRLGEHFDLRFLPGLQFGERQIIYNVMQYRKGDSIPAEVPKNITSTFIDFPLYIKYKSKRAHNFRAFVTAGASFKIDLASAMNDTEENPSNTVVKLRRNDFTGDIGVGFDFYTVYFKFSTEIKMSYGFNDMIFREGNLYSDTFDKLKTKMFQISFTFE